jgi:hypothetical protein
MRQTQRRPPSPERPTGATAPAVGSGPGSSPLPSGVAESPPSSVFAIDEIVDRWSRLRQEGVDRESEAKAERGHFLEDFGAITDSVIRPAMQAAADRLNKDGGGGLIEEHKDDPVHRLRIILWMSLEGAITGTPRQDLNPFLQLDADPGLRKIEIWEGDMWEKEGSSRSTSPWELSEISTEGVTERILEILRRAATHGVASAS